MKYNYKKISLNKQIVAGCMLSFVLASCLILILLILHGYVPFGERTLVSGDIDYSQMDLYGYMKDFLTGKNTFGYTLSMYLGGNTMNVFSYSMSSPLNFLLILFDKADFHIFFSVITVLKIGFISSSMYYFLKKWFCGKLNELFSVLLAVSYALSQYSIAQICNIFWLDGVFFLPLMLLGVHRIVTENKRTTFIVTIALAMIFNWYSGAINCIFSVFWFLFEMNWDRHSKKREFELRFFLNKMMQCIFSGIVGIMICAVLFLPTMLAVREGNRGTVVWSAFNSSFLGNLLTVITNATMGSVSTRGTISLFCGSLAFLGCVCFFFSKKIEAWKKRSLGVLFGFVALSFYWQPLVMLFSMLKVVSSFWYRFGYTGIIVVIFIAASYFSDERQEPNYSSLMAAIVAGFSVLLFLVNHYADGDVLKLIYETVVCQMAVAILLVFYAKRESRRSLYALLIICVVCIEMGHNAAILFHQYSLENVSAYKQYVSSEEALVGEILNEDPENYRITQTLTRNMAPGTTTANYNESFGYHYWSLVGYTNSPDDRQRNFMDKLGYRINGENMYIVNTSIVAADSLLGTKYVLSNYDINGYDKKEKYGLTNSKYTYQNPYMFPMAFQYSGNPSIIPSEDETSEIANPFEYHNQLYTALLGDVVNLYEKVEYEKVETDTSVTYTLHVPSGNYALYGNLPWDSNQHYNENIKIDDVQWTPYSCWTSPSVFYIPVQEGRDTVNITLSGGSELSVLEEQFYALNLDTLASVREAILVHPDVELHVGDKEIRMELDAEQDQNVLLSVAYDEAWTITDNGIPIEPEAFADTLTSVPVSKGHHEIVMKYTIPGLRIGSVMCVIGLMLLLLNWLFESKKIRIGKKENEKHAR